MAPRLGDGTAMIVSRLGGRRAAIRPDEPSAAYTAVHTARRERPGPADGRRGRPARTVVELRRVYGGATMRALLGASFAPGAAGAAAVEVRHGTPLELDAACGCRSELGGPLAAGLPSDFVPAVLGALTGAPGERPLPPGLLRVDRAAFDPLGSGTEAFALAAALLRQAIAAQVLGGDPVAVIRAALNRW
jgi:hypothetical protein